MAQIRFQIDDNVKKCAEEVCAEIGISMSTAITIFLKKLGREQRIPFEISYDRFYSEENMARLRENSNMLKYKGYYGTVEYSKDDDILFGKVVGIRSLISYEGDCLQSLKQDFEDGIDSYLESCVELGIEPEKGYARLSSRLNTPRSI